LTTWRSWVGVLGLCLGLLGVLGARSGKVQQPGEVIRLNISTSKPRKRPPVFFSHQVHEQARVDCRQCHHDYRRGRNLWKQGQPVPKCGECHGLFPRGRRPDLKKAYHQQCKGCHLKRRQQGHLAGPIHCRDCHRGT
jgi:hypothetical protein